MDLEVKIKEEQAWLEGTTTASLENFEHVSEVIALKEEVKSELAEPGSLQENYLESMKAALLLKELEEQKWTVTAEARQSLVSSRQRNLFAAAVMPSKDIKEDIFIEEHADDQLLLYIKEETKSRPAVSNADHHPRDGGTRCFRCNVCGKLLSRKDSLAVHTSFHTGEKPISCKICGKSFISKCQLTYHLRKLSGMKSYRCNICEKSFTNEGKLTCQMRTHTGEKPYWCNICEKSFIRKYHITLHMRTYTGDKLHCCNVCEKSFNQKGHLAFHVRTHTGEKPFCCNVCGKSFTQKFSLICHMRKHTGEKQYMCNICEKSLNSKSHVTFQTRTHTGAMSVANPPGEAI